MFDWQSFECDVGECHWKLDRETDRPAPFCIGRSSRESNNRRKVHALGPGPLRGSSTDLVESNNKSLVL